MPVSANFINHMPHHLPSIELPLEDSPTRISQTMNACRNVFSSCLNTVDERIAEIAKKIPIKNRFGLFSPKSLVAAITSTYAIYAYSQNATSFWTLQCLNFSFSCIYDRATYNSHAKEIRQVIENSHLEKEHKKGVAVILNASKWSDFNCAFANNEQYLRTVTKIAKEFLIESKTVSSAEELLEAMKDIHTRRDKPKLVLVRGHGDFLKGIQLSPFCSLKSDDDKLIEALDNTDEKAHIILQSCSTAKLRSEQGISFADQLSLKLPGRMVTGTPIEGVAALIENNNYPQNLTLMCMDGSKQIPTHSFSVIGNQRLVTTLVPSKKENNNEEYMSLELMGNLSKATNLDAKSKTESLFNKYKLNFNYNFNIDDFFSEMQELNK